MEKIKGYLYAAISSITYGMIPLFTFPVMAEGMNFESILFYRFILAAAVIGAVMMFRKERIIPSLSELPVIIFLGLIYTGSSMFLFWSFRYLAGGVAATIMFLYPVFVALIMWILYRERISAMTAFAVAIAILGVVMLYKGDGNGSLDPVGVVLALLSGISYGSYMIVVNKSRKLSGMSGMQITFYACFMTAVFSLAAALFSGGLQGIPSFSSAMNLTFLAILPTAFSCIALAAAVRIIGSTLTSILGSLEPLSAVVCGLLFLGEPFTSSLAMGIFMIIASVLIIVMEKAKDKVLDSLRSLKGRSGRN